MTAEKLNCWQDLRCGLEPGGMRAGQVGVCPAASDTTCDGINGGTNGGRFCWAVTGTLCRGQIQGTLEKKLESCQQCSFFRRVKYEEGPHFQLLKPALETDDPAHLHRLLNDVIRLTSIYRDVFACLTVRPLLERIVEHACAVTRSASASAYLAAPSAEHLVLEAHVGPTSRPPRIALREDAPVAEAVRKRRLCKRTELLPGIPHPAVIAAVPIGGYETPAGALELVKTSGSFSADDEWFLREFGLTAGLGMENARHVEDLRQLKRFDKAKSRFVALLMHHIASPLATVACSLQALSQLGDKLSDEDRRKLIANSLDRVGTIQGLTRRLLDLAAIRSGTSLAALQPVRPSAAVRQEVEDRTALAREKALEVVMSDRAARSLVLADPDGLRVIFGNLIDNAIKYSGGPGKRVNVEVADQENYVLVRISDQGIGIPHEEQAKIFEEFHRGSNAAARTPGFGLGLAVARELVDRYGGRIELESEPGEGTTVSVFLPVASDAPTADARA